MKKTNSSFMPIRVKEPSKSVQHTLLPKIESERRAAEGKRSLYSTMRLSKGAPNKSIIESNEEATLLKDIWSGKSGHILSKIEKFAINTEPAKNARLSQLPSHLAKDLSSTPSLQLTSKLTESIDGTFSRNNMTFTNKFQKESCRFCPHCQANSLGMHKVKQVLKPYFDKIIEEKTGLHLPTHLLNTSKVKDYYTREKIEGDDSKYLDLAIEMLLNKKLVLNKVVDNDTIKKLSDIDICNAMSLFKRKDLSHILDRVSKITDKCAYFKQAIKNQQQDVDISSTETASVLSKMRKSLKHRTSDPEYPIAVFTCIQELVREFTLSSKERGGLLLRAIYSLFDENESRWLQLIEILLDALSCLEQECSTLMQGMQLKADDINLVLNNLAPTDESLADHKRLIRELLSNLHHERSKRLNLETEVESLSRQLNLWVLKWDTLKVSKRVTDKLATLTEPAVRACSTFHFNGKMMEDEKALSLNIERLVQALPGKYRFEEEKEQFKTVLKEKEEMIENLKGEVQDLTARMGELSVENNKLVEEIKANNEYTSRALKILKLKEFHDVETQIDAEELLEQRDYENSLHSGTAHNDFDNILFEVKEGRAKESPLPMTEVLKQLKFFYAKFFKQYSDDSIPIPSSFSLFVPFTKYLWERYDLKDVALKKCRLLLCSVNAYLAHDERIDSFAGFVGLKEQKFPPEASFIYIKLLQASQFPLESIFGKDWNAVIDYESANACMRRVVVNGTKELHHMMRRGLFARGRISVNGGPAEIITSKNSLTYWLVYQLSRAAKKKKLATFMEGLIEHFSAMTAEQIKTGLVQVIAKITKVAKEREIGEFVEERCRDGQKYTTDRIIRLFKSSAEVTVDFSAYVHVGQKIVEQYVEKVKEFAAGLVSAYGKKQAHHISQDEINELLNDKIKEVNENWRIVAFMEACFRENKGQSINEQEFASLLLNKPLLHKVVQYSAKH